MLTRLGGAGQSQPCGGGVNNISIFPTALPPQSGGELLVNEQVIK